MFKKMYAAHLEAVKNRKGPVGDFPYEISYMFQSAEGWFKIHNKEDFAKFLDEYDLWNGLTWTEYTNYLEAKNVGMDQQFCVKFI